MTIKSQIIFPSILDTVGNTPLIQLNKLSSGRVYAKAEYLNPGGSIKDRVAKYILESALSSGELRPGMVIIESTSGNTGIGLSLIGFQMGYRVICVMPENMSEERKKIIRAFGGEIVFTPEKESLAGCLKTMEQIVKEDPEKYYVVNQFINPLNPEVHYQQTGPEIWNDLNGDVGVFIAGVGRGGTLQGVGKFLKEQNENIKIVAVEPKNSAALLGREPGLHQMPYRKLVPPDPQYRQFQPCSHRIPPAGQTCVGHMYLLPQERLYGSAET